MATSTHLFELIKTLSSSEKRYFRLYCNFQGGEKNYLRLFDFLERNEKYNEEQIRETFHNETFTKSLHVTKNYLYNLILKSLRSFHAQSHVDQKIGDLISDLSLLEGRGLYQQARQSLIKAKKLASKYHRYYYLAFLLRKEATYHFAIDQKNMIEKIGQINVELNDVNKILLEENKIFELYHQSTFLQRTRTTSDETLLTLKNKIKEFQSDFGNSTNQSFYTTYLKESIQSAIAYGEKNKKNRYDSTKKIVAIWKNHPHMIQAEPHVYKIHLSNFLNAAFQSVKYSDFPKILSELSEIPSRNFNEEAETFQNLTFYQLLYFLNTKDLDNALDALSTITQGLVKYQSKINKARELAFYYNISILYLMLDDIDLALLWLNKIINQTKTDHRKDLQRFSEILQLFYHFNLKNFQLLDSLLISVRKKISRWQALTPFEELIFQNLKSLLHLLSKKERHEFLKTFKIQLSVFKKNQGDQIPLGFDEIILWIDRELERKNA